MPVLSDKEFYAVFLDFIDNQQTEQEMKETQIETLQRYYKPDYVCGTNYDDVNQAMKEFKSLRD